jgi:hypothetical protein
MRMQNLIVLCCKGTPFVTHIKRHFPDQALAFFIKHMDFCYMLYRRKAGEDLPIFGNFFPSVNFLEP